MRAGVKTTSRRLADRKVEKFEKNITKRGFVPDTTTKKGKDYPVGPVLLGQKEQQGFSMRQTSDTRLQGQVENILGSSNASPLTHQASILNEFLLKS
ncbi:hypothetical protein JHK86_021001 [Glycine max]|nr:hypothetical protein JHK86_021001 [Glycine max]